MDPHPQFPVAEQATERDLDELRGTFNDHQRDVLVATKRIHESFREVLFRNLPIIQEMMDDPTISKSVKFRALVSLAKYAGLPNPTTAFISQTVEHKNPRESRPFQPDVIITHEEMEEFRLQRLLERDEERKFKERARERQEALPAPSA